MSWRTDMRDPKKCSVCHEISYRVDAGDSLGIGEFEIPAHRLPDPEKADGEDLLNKFAVLMYMCSKCDHLDLYGIRIDPIAP